MTDHPRTAEALDPLFPGFERSTGLTLIDGSVGAHWVGVAAASTGSDPERDDATMNAKANAVPPSHCFTDVPLIWGNGGGERKPPAAMIH